MGPEEAEALAESASIESGLDDRPHADPAVMAVAYCGLRLVPVRGSSARLVEDRLYYPARVDPKHRAYLQAHEVGHDLIRYAGWRLAPALEERMASRVGCAILLPRRAYLRDVRAVGSDLVQLGELWHLVTPWVLARRLCELHGAFAVRRRQGHSTETVGHGDPVELRGALDEAEHVGVARAPGVCAVRCAPREVVAVRVAV
jgi:hypothetical protein